MEYLAKSDPEETIEEHTNQLIKLWELFCHQYGDSFQDKERELIRLAAFYHDLGKVNPQFQQKIYRANHKQYAGLVVKGDEIPHGFLSCAYINIDELKKFYSDDDIGVLVTVVYNHHIRKDYMDDAKLVEYINNYLPQAVSFNGVKTVKPNDEYLDYILLNNRMSTLNTMSDEVWLKYLVVKGMLNKLDYCASAKCVSEIEISQPDDKNNLTTLVLNKLSALRAVQNYMSERRNKNIVVLAATGSGKTEAALLWIHNAKAFYTLPLKVSINAIYERILNDYHYDRNRIRLLHSGALAYYFEQQSTDQDGVNEDILLQNQKARLLSYPLTICTVDQLFWFVFKSLGSEIVPATLKYSKLVIDEIQMYTPDILACIVYGLKVITQLGGKFAIITATFPPVLHHFLKMQGINYEVSEKFLGEFKQRHKIKFCSSDFEYDKIIAQGKFKKVLVLCNTVKKAQEVYRNLWNQDVPVYLLHSRFALKDRKILEEAIMQFSKDKQPGIWVSTQIVEASLDIDFDVLFTEMCTADSLLQRMGRCYRKREYYGNEANVYIYDTKTGYGRVYDKDIYDFSVEALQVYNNSYFSEAEKFEYINKVFDTKRLKDSKSNYYKTIKEKIAILENLYPANVDLETAKKQFRNIQSITIMPDIYYTAEVEDLIEIINNKEMYALNQRIKAQNRLLNYTISLDIHNVRSKKSQKFIDKKPMAGIEWMNIYRCTAKYEFDEKACRDGRGLSGKGLDLEEEDEKNNVW